MKRILFIVAMMATLCIGANAQQGPSRVPAYPGVIERTQPNGYTLRTYLRGDERQHWAMTEDGWQILENKKGWLVYAKQKKDGTVIASNKKARNAADRCKCEKRWLEKHGKQFNVTRFEKSQDEKDF